MLPPSGHRVVLIAVLAIIYTRLSLVPSNGRACLVHAPSITTRTIHEAAFCHVSSRLICVEIAIILSNCRQAAIRRLRIPD
jgi:hypothetical protein